MSDYRDYLWVEDFGFFDSDGYCMALVAASTPETVLSGLGALAQPRLSVVGAHDAVREGHAIADQHGVDGVATQLVAVTALEAGWTMVLQAPGFLGISDDAMSEIVPAHEVVSHGADRFVWWSQGLRRISFEPLLPQSDLVGVLADRQEPDARAQIVALIDEVGGIDLEETPGTEFHHVAGSFALAERLTGLRITRAILDDSNYVVAVVRQKNPI